MIVNAVLSDVERARLKSVRCFKSDAAGHVSDVDVRPSGSTAFDADVAAVPGRAGRLPRPPPETQAWVSAGVCFNFCPATCE